MNNFMDQYFTVSFFAGLQNFIVAILVLLIGWFVAKALSNVAEKTARRTNLDEKLFNKFRTGGKRVNSNKIIGKTVYYVLLLMVIILFFNILSLNMIANPLADLIATFLAFIPAVLKAALILVFAWVIATAVQWIIVKGTKKINLQHLFFKMKVAKSEEEIDTYIERIGKVGFYLILLLFIPGVLDALNIQGVVEPFSGLLAIILAFIPRLLAAALIFAIGWFVAKIIKNIIVNLLQAAGSEKLVARLKLTKVFEGSSLAIFVGNLAFIVLMIPITIAALEKLKLTGITDPAIVMLEDIMNMIPNLLVAIGLILVGLWLGKFIGGFVKEYLQRLGFDRLSSKMNIGKNTVTSMTPSAIVGYVVQILIVFFLTVQALYLIKLQFLVGIASAITAYLPNVLAAVIILGAALILANIVQKVLLNILSGQATALLAAFAKYTIIVIAVFMALTQLGIATDIVKSAFILILGGIALAFGLAFGLGGKEFASKYLSKFDKTIEETTVKEMPKKAPKAPVTQTTEVGAPIESAPPVVVEPTEIDDDIDFDPRLF